MPDPKDNNPMPEVKSPTVRKVLKWLSWALALGGPSFAAYVAMMSSSDVKTALIIALGLLTTVAASLRSGLSNPLKTGAAGAGIVLVIFALAGCPSTSTSARVVWMKSTAGVMKATQLTSQAVAVVAAADMDSGGDVVKICARLVAYRDNARPAARSSVAASYATYRIVQEFEKNKDAYLAILKPGGCGLILMLREWGHKLPDKGAAILALLDAFTGVVCDKVRRPKTTILTTIVVLLPVVVDLVKWIVSLVGADSDTLQKEINAWIQADPADEVDALIKKRCPAPTGSL